MKKSLVIVMTLVITICCNAQSKKELAESVKTLTERCANLESQMSNWQSLLMTLQNAQLEQAKEIKALQDSLAVVKKGAKETEPKAKTLEERLELCNYTKSEKEVLTVLDGFFRANSWEEKYKFVMPDEKVLKAMKEKYPKGSSTGFDVGGYSFVGIEKDPKEKYLNGRDKFFSPEGNIIFGVDNGAEGKVVEAINKPRYHFYLVKTKAGYKIDYAASFRLDDRYDCSYYVKDGITTPFDIRVYQGTVYYPDEHHQSRVYWRIKGTNYGAVGFENCPSFYFLVSKSDPIYKTIKANETDAKHRYILKVAYDPNLENFVIKKMIKDGTWSYYDMDK